MKTKYEVVDSGFNRENYPDLIGKVYDVPPSYAQVKLIKERTPMSEIYKFQSRMFEEKEAGDMVEDFVMKCVRAGYDQKEIVEGIREFYRQAPEVGNQIFTRAIIKMKNLGKNVDKLLQPKKASANWYKKAQFETKMMPGQTPYTDEELKQLHKMVGDAAEGDPGEANEPPIYNWTPEERDIIEVMSEAVDNFERNDRMAKIKVIKNYIGDSTLSFDVEFSYAVDTQLETMWDTFSSSLYVEKVAPDYFEVNIDHGGFRQYDNFEEVKEIIQSFPQ